MGLTDTLREWQKGGVGVGGKGGRVRSVRDDSPPHPTHVAHVLVQLRDAVPLPVLVLLHLSAVTTRAQCKNGSAIIRKTRALPPDTSFTPPTNNPLPTGGTRTDHIDE